MAIGSIMPFRPTGTVSWSPTGPLSYVTLAGGGDSVVVTNCNTSLVYVRFGSDTSVTATVADMPVMPNSRVMLGINYVIGYVAVMLASGSGTGNVLFTRGDGSYL